MGTKRIECRMNFPAGSYFDVLIQINDRADKALLTIKNNYGKEIHKKELIVSKEENSLHILKKCNDV
jgi:hypothetical protein